MAYHVETFDGGLVTSRPASLLKPGELTGIREMAYGPGSLLPKKAPGFITGYAFGGGPTGIRLAAAEFSNGTSYLIAQAAGGLWRSTPGGVLSFSAISGGAMADGGPLTATHVQDRFYLFNGTGNNRVLRNDGTVRQHGMSPVTTGPGYLVTTVASAWPDAFPGYFEYWTTEVAKFTENGIATELESTFTGQPATVFIADVNKKVTISRPEVVNTNFATHWRVYRSPLKLLATDVGFPTGELVGELALNMLTYVDGQPTATGALTAGALVAAGGWTVSSPPTELSSNNGVYATASNTHTGEGVYPSNSKTMTVNTFGFSGLSDPITGIEVVVDAKIDVAPTNVTLSIGLSDDNGATYVWKTANLATADTLTTLGGQDDQWGRRWLSTSFSNANFRVAINASSVQNGTTVVSVDLLSVKVYYGGAHAFSGVPFPAVIVAVEGAFGPTGADGLPPKADIGCEFSGCLVTNDVSSRTITRHSIAGRPESFPAIYYINYEIGGNVTYVGTLGRRLAVGCKKAIWRVNFLPTEADATYAPGVVKDIVSPSLGIPNSKSACVYAGTGQGPELAFVNEFGVFTTDLYNTPRCLTLDLDWGALIHEAQSSNFKIIDVPERFELLVLISDSGGSVATNHVIHLNYHPRHLKYAEGQGWLPKISGPTTCAVSGQAVIDLAAWRNSNGNTFVYGGHDTTAVTAYTDGVESSTTTPLMTTRDLRLGGLGGEFYVDELLTQALGGGAEVASVEYLIQKTDGAEISAGQKTFSPNGRMHKVAKSFSTEGLRLRYTWPNTSVVQMQFAVVKYRAQGKQDAAKQ